MPEDNGLNALEVARRLWERRREMVYGGAALGALSYLFGTIPRRDKRPSASDIDIDVPRVSPTVLQKMMIETDEEPVLGEDEDEDEDRAKTAAKDDGGLGFGEWDRAILAGSLVGAPLLGFAGGRGLARLFARTPSDELEDAKEDYRRALIAEQLAALRYGGTGDMKRLPVKSGQADNTEDWADTLWKPISKIAPFYGAYAIPAMLLAGWIAKDKFSDESEERRRYEKARDVVERRLASSMPRARLEPLDEDDEALQEAREILDRRGV